MMNISRSLRASRSVTFVLLVAITSTVMEACLGFVVSRDGTFSSDKKASTSSGRWIQERPCRLPLPLPLPLSLASPVLCSRLPPRVWIEDAEEGFVDEDENLEPGEVCLKSVKSFASGVVAVSDHSVDIRVIRDVNDESARSKHGGENDKRFLSAGALVQRPSHPDCTYEECAAGGQCRDANASENDSSSLPTTTSTVSTVSTSICDAWMADSILTEGGPNLQLQGALKVLDDLFLFHLQREQQHTQMQMQMQMQTQQHTEADMDITNGVDDSEENHPLADPSSFGVRALRNFVVHCGEDDDGNDGDKDCEDDHLGGIETGRNRSYRSEHYVAASQMAARMRGFVPLREMVRVDSIYHSRYYDHDLTGMVPDCRTLPDLYRMAAREGNNNSNDDDATHTARRICELLPDGETIARHTTKRFSIGRRPSSLSLSLP